jgi:hypothetical protein
MGHRPVEFLNGNLTGFVTEQHSDHLELLGHIFA